MPVGSSIRAGFAPLGPIVKMDPQTMKPLICQANEHTLINGVLTPLKAWLLHESDWANLTGARAHSKWIERQMGDKLDAGHLERIFNV